MTPAGSVLRSRSQVVAKLLIAARENGFALFGVLYGACLLVFACFAVGAGPLHRDMTEAWAWGKEFQLGYAKHPPLSAWLAGAWFAVMPRAEWSFYVLAVVNVSIALAGIWSLAGLFLDNRGRWAAVYFAVLSPSLNLWGLKFNANAPLLSTWPWTVYFFLRSLESPRMRYAILAGSVGAAALLTKYYSLLLFASLGLAALLHPNRARYFRSSAPFLTSATGLLITLPHIWWTIASGFPTIDYAVSKTQFAVAEARTSAIHTVLAAPCFFGLSTIAYCIAMRDRAVAPFVRVARAALQPCNAWLFALACGPFALTVAAYLLGNVRITLAFLIPAFFALPVVFVVLSGSKFTRRELCTIAACVAAIGVPLTVVSPVLGAYKIANGAAKDVEPVREMALAATAAWQANFGRPLKFVAANEHVATAVAFYSPDAPSYHILERPEYSPWVTNEALRRDGLLIVCRPNEEECLTRATQLAQPGGLQWSQEFARSWFGRTAKAQAYVLFMQPPASLR
jgi:4-amino-4-deoxy-L-arabinose transferase-like glycosyltransferase